VIVDDATGKPAWPSPIPQHPHVQYLDKRWCYVTNRFSLTLPASEVGIEIRRGLETRPIHVSVPGGGNSKTIQKEFR
jgi:hypothetical protein